MTHLRKMMLEELERRNYAQTTRDCYIQTIEDFARYFKRPPDQLGPEHIREYQAYLFRERKLAARTVTQRLAALRFFFIQTMKKPWCVADTPYPKKARHLTIFVLDRLNSSSDDFAFFRYSVRKFLAAQPAQLNSPAELMVVGNESLEMLQGYTRNKADLLYALDHLPPALPYKEMQGAFYWERVAQSIDALQQIALQNTGVPGRKNIVWVGRGGPGVNLGSLTGSDAGHLQHYVHATNNM